MKKVFLLGISTFGLFHKTKESSDIPTDEEVVAETDVIIGKIFN